MSVRHPIMYCGGRSFSWGKRTYIMGIINVTPDSFSGDGLSYDVEAAVRQGERFEQEGADILDVGGESTRPGSTPVSEEEEVRRVIPVIQRLAGAVKIPISVDTYKARVARLALEAGANMLNDIWGLKHDLALAQVAGEHGVPLVLMHNQVGTHYNDLVPDILRSLKESVAKALKAGVKPEAILVDPGFGFGKTLEQNLEVLRRLDEFTALGYPILIGTSRKSMVGRVLDLPVQDRLEGTAATVALGIAKGTDIVRVHDVQAMVRVCRMTDAVLRGFSTSGAT